MEVNKEQAEKCRDLGAEAMRRGDWDRANKMFEKSLRLFPLPGVAALMQQAEQQQQSGGGGGGGGSSSSSPRQASNGTRGGSSGRPRSSSPGEEASASSARTATASAPSTASTTTTQSGTNGRNYSDEQVQVVKQVLRAKEGGRGAHYRVLGLSHNCTEAEIKKAYRKLSLKVHPDKNSAPHADEAFKAVGMAYATLSDSNKRTIYDRYGEEDPDQRGGAGPGGMHMRHGGQEVSPEEIFNMFFGGGMPGNGGPGFHVYTNGFGFGPGVHFGPGGRRRRAAPGQEQQQQEETMPGLGGLVNLLPMLLIMLVTFFRFSETDVSTPAYSYGEQKYFSLTQKPPFLHPRETTLTHVKEIPYYVSDRFLRTYARDRSSLIQVEHMVENAYENYLFRECQKQEQYQKRLLQEAKRERTPAAKARALQQAQEFQFTRCQELDDLFPKRRQHHQHKRR